MKNVVQKIALSLSLLTLNGVLINAQNQTLEDAVVGVVDTFSSLDLTDAVQKVRGFIEKNKAAFDDQNVDAIVTAINNALQGQVPAQVAEIIGSGKISKDDVVALLARVEHKLNNPIEFVNETHDAIGKIILFLDPETLDLIKSIIPVPADFPFDALYSKLKQADLESVLAHVKAIIDENPEQVKAVAAQVNSYLALLQSKVQSMPAEGFSAEQLQEIVGKVPAIIAVLKPLIQRNLPQIKALVDEIYARIPASVIADLAQQLKPLKNALESIKQSALQKKQE